MITLDKRHNEQSYNVENAFSINSDAKYKHVAVFDSRHSAVTHINNFTGTIARLVDEYKGKFQTKIVPSILCDNVVFFVIFQTKEGVEISE